MVQRFVRLRDPQGKAHYALEAEEGYRLISGNIFRVCSETQEMAGKDWRLLPPCLPTKIIGLGLNYQDHANEMGFKYPKEPVLFMKPSSAVVGQGDEIIWPDHWVKRLDYEGELAVVMGQVCHNCSPEEVERYIFGYTCVNDVTARDLQPSDGQWTLAKSFDSFCPLGPVIARGIEPGNLRIRSYLNGELKQDSNTENLIFDVFQAVSYISQCMTLFPGDVVMTGTPSGVGPMADGDVVRIEIENIGALENKVRAVKQDN